MYVAILLAVIALAVSTFPPRMKIASRMLLALSIFTVGVIGMAAALLIFVSDLPQGCSRNVEVQNGELVPAGPIENCD